jgi:hypothetical protein
MGLFEDIGSVLGNILGSGTKRTDQNGISGQNINAVDPNTGIVQLGAFSNNRSQAANDPFSLPSREDTINQVLAQQLMALEKRRKNTLGVAMAGNETAPLATTQLFGL